MCLFVYFWCWSLNWGPHTCSGHVPSPGYTCRYNTSKWPSRLHSSHLAIFLISANSVICSKSSDFYVMFTYLLECWRCLSSLLVANDSVLFWSRKTGRPRVQPMLLYVKWKFPLCQSPKQMFYGVSLLSSSGFGWENVARQKQHKHDWLAHLLFLLSLSPLHPYLIIDPCFFQL